MIQTSKAFFDFLSPNMATKYYINIQNVVVKHFGETDLFRFAKRRLNMVK